VISILGARTQELEKYMLERSSRDTEAFFSSTAEFQIGGAALESSLLADQHTDKMILAKMDLTDSYVEGDDVDGAEVFPQGGNPVPDSNNNSIQLASQSQSFVDNVTLPSNPQYQGKRCLMAKHMRTVVMLHNSISIPDNVRSNVLDFSRCALTDDDMIQLVDWMRLMGLAHVQTIDFRSNLLTTQGVMSFCTYLLSIRGDEFKRDVPVLVLFNFNKVFILIIMIILLLLLHIFLTYTMKSFDLFTRPLYLIFIFCVILIF
jgi:hypothetical protein